MEECDVRAIVRLLGDPDLFRRDSESRRRVLLANLCRLIGGDTWSYSFRPSRKADCGEGAIELSGGTGESDRRLATAQRQEVDKPRNFHLEASLIADGAVSRIQLSRAPGRRPFTARERRIAQIVLTETAWLHEPVSTCTPAPEPLSPRQRATLICVAEGMSRCEIAERLRISQHTVDDYLKVIYRRYGVNSRAMLIKRLTLMDEGELAP